MGGDFRNHCSIRRIAQGEFLRSWELHCPTMVDTSGFAQENHLKSSNCTLQSWLTKAFMVKKSRCIMFRNPLHLCLISPWRLHCGTDDFLVVPREWQPCWWGFPIDRWAMKSIYQLSGSNKSWVQGLQGLSVEVWSLLNSYSLLGTKLEKPLRLDLFLVEIGRTPKIWNTWTFFFGNTSSIPILEILFYLFGCYQNGYHI